MAPSFNSEDSQLIADLFKLSKKSPKLVKSSTYTAPADPTISIRSWKMNEFKYYDVPSPFPTLARGIFTVEVSREENLDTEKSTSTDAALEKMAQLETESRYRIVARGYDKFFNIGEVPWVTWPSLESHTSPPYTLSLKSNGCIIFIAALTPTNLLITSKHSLGPVHNVETSHAQAGEKWLRKYLEQKGRSEEELSRTLWDLGVTAVAELCDDSFEEHVLPYPPHKTGLHLHGLNTNTKAFHTLPTSQVDAFAREWGFIQTPTVVLDSVDQVKKFTDEVAETGVWEGEMVEGFVVRTRVSDGDRSMATTATTTTTTTTTTTEKKEKGKGKGNNNNNNNKTVKSPYPPNSSFFFKVKFDEPYMMYRDWRELTKKLLSSSSQLTLASLPRSKLARPETRLYARWVIDEIKRDKGQFDGYTKGKGIVRTRERFLEWMEGEEGRRELAGMKGGVGVGKEEGGKKVGREGVEGEKRVQKTKTIIVPVAIPGCGKTAVSVALAHIFGFGHTQSDDVMTKKAAPQFIKNVTALLEENDVVIADKNNHLVQHRQALRSITTTNPKSQSNPKQHPPIRLIALNWDLSSLPQATVHRICSDRITHRGPNHQTLRPALATATTTTAASDMTSHEDVVWMFLTSREELSSSEVDDIVDMQLGEGLEASVNRAVDGIVGLLGWGEEGRGRRPSEEKVREGVRVAEEYKTKVKKPDGGNKKRDPVRYYALLVELDLEEALNKALLPFANANANVEQGKTTLEAEALKFWTELKTGKSGSGSGSKGGGGGLVSKRPHVTVVHRNSLPGKKDLWERCEELVKVQSSQMLFRARLGNLVWDGDAMALTVDELSVVGGAGAECAEEEEVKESLKKGKQFLDELPEKLKQRLHVTVATANQSIPPVHAKSLVEDWRDGKKRTTGSGNGHGNGGEIRAIELKDVYAVGRIRGLVN